MINDPYILFTRIPLTKDDSGHIYCNPLWGKDLKLHLNYIAEFGICCPVEKGNDTAGLMDITEFGIRYFFELKRDYGLKSVLQNLLPNFAIVIKACKTAKIVHSGGAGWAFPLSFYLLLLRPFFSFRWIIVIESSFWKIEQGEKITLRRAIEHYTHKLILTRCVKIADARIFTQSFYRKYFLGNKKERTLINPATWVDKEYIATPDLVRRRFQNRADNKIKIIFPTRLIKDKGVFVVFDAINKIKMSNVNKDIQITIMGSGELEKECRDFASNDYGNIKIELKKPAAYGKEFFEILAQHDFVLVPTLKQEQPRIIFDAFSQGVPVIGSDTSGIKDITNAENAFTFKTGDSSSLAEVICQIAEDPRVALKKGLAGLDYASGKTHLQMHLDREAFLNDLLCYER